MPIVSFKEKEKTTYAREKGQEVVMLNVKKRSGQNMISAIDQIKEKIKKAQENVFTKKFEIENLQTINLTDVEHQVRRIFKPHYFRNRIGNDSFDVHNGITKFTYLLVQQFHCQC